MFNIPNLFTAANLMCGVMSIILTLAGRIDIAPFAIFLGGLFGGIIGMLIFRHKISKRPFLLKFFVVAILQLIILRFILRILWN